MNSDLGFLGIASASRLVGLALAFALRPAVLPLLQEAPPPRSEVPAAAAAEGESKLAADAAALGSALPDDLRRAMECRLRVLDVAAHPDDEDGALLLTYAARGAETTALFATRGERR